MRRATRTSHCRRTLSPRSGSFFLLGLLALGASVAGAQAHGRFPKVVELPGRVYRSVDERGRVQVRPLQAVADRLIVRLRPGATLASGQAAAARVGGRLSRYIPRSRIAIVDFAAGTPLNQADAALSTQSVFEFAEPDILMYPAAIPTDDRYADQWHHPVIRSPEAWDVSTGSINTVIAVIDSGLDLDHPDIASKVYTNPGEIAGNGVDDDNNGYTDDVNGWNFLDDNNDVVPKPDGIDNDGNGLIDDQVRHGTLVSGLAAAAANNGGAVGMDWGARILPLKVFADDGGTQISTVVEAMAYAVNMGADVINLSLGGGFSDAFNVPVADAHSAGVLVVAASGNSDVEFTQNPSTWSSPACNDGPNVGVDNFVLGVSATDQTDRRASFSNYDSSGYKFVDVSAPGQAVFGPGFQDDAIPMFTVFYAKGNGTSFSSPIVAGLAGLLMAQTPGITHDQIIQRIRDTADDVDSTNPGFVGKLGTGRINVARSLGVDLPPQPVTNLRATDTSGDEGGSITLRWFRSRDDGSGANDVVKYVVQRSEVPDGTFEERGEVAAGTDTFADTAVDGVDHYYVVETHDAGGQDVTSDVVGPATAADDTPPPAVAGVTAIDRPGDGGGAIQLSWDPYSDPGDFVSFRVYRAEFRYVSVDGMIPAAIIHDDTAAGYLDNNVVDGVDYWYAVTAADEVPNQIADVASIGPVQAFANQGLTINPGMHFLTAPIVSPNRNPADYFAIPPQELVYGRWDPSRAQGQGQYLFYHMAPTDPFLALAHGRGFWLGVTQQIFIDPAGEVTPSGPFAIDLQPGWRQLGNPFLGQFRFSRSTVEYQGVTMDLASASASGIINRFAWVYDSAAGDYDLIDESIAADNDDGVINPWQGFWVQVLKPCQLVLDRGIGISPGSVSTASVKPPQPDWHVRVVARAENSQDTSNYFGVASEPSRFDVQAPPAVGNGVRLDFHSQGADATPYAASFRQPSATGAAWDFTVFTPGPGNVIVTTPDLSPVPPEYGVLLSDLDAGRNVELRTTALYSFTAAEQPGERHFKLTVRRKTRGLAVTALSATPTRGGGGEIRFSLTSDAACDLHVMNIAGRRVREVVTSRVCTSGQQVISWSGRNDNGVQVPSGVYLVRVNARSADGETVQALSSISVHR